MNPEVLQDLAAFSFSIREGYGFTETFGAISVNPIKNLHLGLVGKLKKYHS